MDKQTAADAPVLITDAPRSYQEEFDARRRRYSIMMAMRIPFLVAAALCAHIAWLAATLILLSIPFPWMAVLIANDRLPRKSTTFRRHRDAPEQQRIEPASSGAELMRR